MVGVIQSRSTGAITAVAGVVVGHGASPGGTDGYCGLLARDSASQGMGRERHEGKECFGERRHVWSESIREVVVCATSGLVVTGSTSVIASLAQRVLPCKRVSCSVCLCERRGLQNISLDS